MLTPVYDIYGRDYYYFTISLYYLSLYHPILYLSYLVTTVTLVSSPSSPSRLPLRGSKGPTRDEGEEGRRFLGKESSPLEPIRELG